MNPARCARWLSNDLNRTASFPLVSPRPSNSRSRSNSMYRDSIDESREFPTSMGVTIDMYRRDPLNQKLRSIAPSNVIRSTAVKPILPRKELVSSSCLFRYRHCAYFCFLPVSRCPFTECQGHVAVGVAAKSRLCCR